MVSEGLPIVDHLLAEVAWGGGGVAGVVHGAQVGPQVHLLHECSAAQLAPKKKKIIIIIIKNKQGYYLLV